MGRGQWGVPLNMIHPEYSLTPETPVKAHGQVHEEISALPLCKDILRNNGPGFFKSAETTEEDRCSKVKETEQLKELGIRSCRETGNTGKR